MCGIFVSMGDMTNEQMKDVLEILHHRGPDEGSAVLSNGVHLGHRRLSIIGLDNGIQPLHNKEKDRWIVCNGEIYNFESIKKQLEDNGSHFLTQSDSEVALKLTEKHGPQSIEQLDGMFAFFIADEKNQSFLVARDTLGIKPLYYGKDKKGHYVFSSELKAIESYVTQAIEFPHGHYFTPEEGFVCYREITQPDDTFDKEELDQVLQSIRYNLNSAVRKRMMADVEVGVLLSGGLDSSLIAALAHNYNKRQTPLKSFCVGAEGSSDVLNARIVADAIGTDHYEYIYSEQELLEAVSDVIYHLESYEPSLVRSAIPNYFVSKLAAKHVKVILSGEGADELFAGYAYMKKFQNTELMNKEIIRILNTLHNVNLQRADRMSMAHSLELRVPFLDLDVVENALEIPSALKIHKKDRMEKWILRKAFDGTIPDEVLWRKKAEFSEGSGAIDILNSYAEKTITDEELSKINQESPHPIRSKQEGLYYLFFKKHFPNESLLNTVGRWATA